MKSLCVKIFLTLALLIGFSYGTVYAQGVDFSVWDGSLWKIKQTAKGYYFSDEMSTLPDGKVRGTEQVWGVMTADITGTTISMNIYEKGSGGNCSRIDTIDLYHQAGGPLGFVAQFTLDEEGDIYATGLLYFSGKLKDYALQKGKMTSLGGYVLDKDFDEEGDLAAFGISMKGTTVNGLGCNLLP